jgi:hypothetical protein
MRAHVAVLVVLLTGLLSCAAGHEAEALHPGLPAIGGLDGLKSASDLVQLDPDVTAPLLALNTQLAAPALDVLQAPLAYAIYRVDPADGTPLSAQLGGSGQLWLLAADFATGRWTGYTALDSGSALLDLSSLGCKSPAGYTYVAVVATPQAAGRIESLELAVDMPPVIGLTATANAAGITLRWPDLGADSYKVLRSTVQADASPYQVGTVAEAHSGLNSFVETVPQHADGTWTAANRDNGTPADSSDDYPSVAPAVRFYYSLIPVTGGVDGPRTSEVDVLIPWAGRRSQRRALPDTSHWTRVFADQLDVAAMTPAQLEFCATRMVGTQKIVKRRANELRAYNPDFLVLGYHLGVGAGDIGNACGNDWDADADWPYVERHEDWLHHMPGSPQPALRVLQQDWGWFVTDPDSAWQQYLGANLLQLMGEDHYDGWFIDSCSQPWNTDPAQWWEGGDMFAFWTPQLSAMLGSVNSAADAHPLQPYIIPNAGSYVTTVSDITYYGCDGIMIEGHAHWAPASYYSPADWKLQHDRILAHQAAGLLTILQTDIDLAQTSDRQFVYGSYLLVRGPLTYINWLGQGQSNGIGQWYPEWDFTPGGPVDGDPPNMDALRQPSGLYLREFDNGMVVVNPTSSAILYSPDKSYEQLQPSGGGNIDAGGLPTGQNAWVPLAGPTLVPGQGALVLRES